jgi:hypothetical protein
MYFSRGYSYSSTTSTLTQDTLTTQLLVHVMIMIDSVSCRRVQMNAQREEEGNSEETSSRLKDKRSFWKETVRVHDL